jgi:hypothetical protein
MTKKPAALSADLVAVKGAAMPAPDMPGRASSPMTRPVAVAQAPAVKPEGEGGLAPLNFRVQASFRREFKTYAAKHDLKLNELLRLSFETYRRQNND